MRGGEGEYGWEGKLVRIGELVLFIIVGIWR